MYNRYFQLTTAQFVSIRRYNTTRERAKATFRNAQNVYNALCTYYKQSLDYAVIMYSTLCAEIHVNMSRGK